MLLSGWSDVLKYSLNRATLDITKCTLMHIFFMYSEDKPKPLLTQHPDADNMYTGESVSFECKVELSSGWDYLWYKNGKALSINSSHFSINPANLSNTGTYVCMATRDKTMYNTTPSDSRKLNIIGEPKNCLLFRGIILPSSVLIDCML